MKKTTYYCDICGKEMNQFALGGIIKFAEYSEYTPSECIRKRDYDMCQLCSKEFLRWLEERSANRGN